MSQLPDLVKRYVEAAVPNPAPVGAKVRLEQAGEMVQKPGGRTLRFKAVEELDLDQVAFVWRARFPLLGPLALRVTDSYQPPEGSLEVRLLGVRLQRHTGPLLARAEGFRYLAEIPWAPQAVLANRQLDWRAIDERTAEVSSVVAGQRIAVRLVFNGTEIEQTAADRPRLEAGGEIARWIGEYSDYRTIAGIRVPVRGEVRYELPEGPFTYWRGRITSVELCQ